MLGYFAQLVGLILAGITVVVTLTNLLSRYLESSRSRWIQGWMQSETGKTFMHAVLDDRYERRRKDP